MLQFFFFSTPSTMRIIHHISAILNTPLPSDNVAFYNWLLNLAGLIRGDSDSKRVLWQMR